MKGKSVRVNVNKIKSMPLLFRKKSCVSKVDPFGVCGKWVGCNAIQYTKFWR